MGILISTVDHQTRERIAYGMGDRTRAAEIHTEADKEGLLMKTNASFAGFLDDILAQLDAPAPKLLFVQGQVANPANPGDLGPEGCRALADFLDARSDDEIVSAMEVVCPDGSDMGPALEFVRDLQKTIRAAADHKGLQVF